MVAARPDQYGGEYTSPGWLGDVWRVNWCTVNSVSIIMWRQMIWSGVVCGRTCITHHFMHGGCSRDIPWGWCFMVNVHGDWWGNDGVWWEMMYDQTGNDVWWGWCIVGVIYGGDDVWWGMMYGGSDVWWGWCMVGMMYDGDDVWLEMMYCGDDVWWGWCMVGMMYCARMIYGGDECMVGVMYGGVWCIVGVMYDGDDVWWRWCIVGMMYGGDDVWWGWCIVEMMYCGGWCIVGMMYGGDYEGVHQVNIGWVVVDHWKLIEFRRIPWFGNRYSDLASHYSDLTKYIAIVT